MFSTVLPSLTHLMRDSRISDAGHTLPPYERYLTHFPLLINSSIFNATNVLLLSLPP